MREWYIFQQPPKQYFFSVTIIISSLFVDAHTWWKKQACVVHYIYNTEYYKYILFMLGLFDELLPCTRCYL